MSWEPEVEGIRERRRRAREHGGAEAVATHRARGRLPVRERIDRLVDAGSFHEIGRIAGHGEVDAGGRLESFTPANYVLGLARIEGRRVAVGGEDFTLRGGSPTPAGLRKSVYAEDLCLRYRVPLVRLLEGGGGSVAGPAGRPGRPSGGDPVYARHRFVSMAEAMATVPVVSAALGPVAGLPAARLAASHLSLMTRQTAQVLVAGPAVVERALGERKTKEELGGAAVHARSGVVDLVVGDEDEAFAAIRRLLSYLPSNVFERAPRGPCEDDPGRQEEELLHLVPRNRRRIYDARRLVRLVVDQGSFTELQPGFGRSLVVGLARLAGQPVGVLANDPRHLAGAMDAEAAEKLRRFVDFFDTFHLPVVAFVDEPGFMIGSAAERAGTIRHGARALFAVVQSRVPWASVIVRKAYGVAAAAHFAPEAHVLAWPSAESGALPVEGGVAVAFRREIESAPDPERHRAELEERLAAGRTPFPRAEAFGVHDLIDPRETRPELCAWIDWIQPLLDRDLGPRSYAVRP